MTLSDRIKDLRTRRGWSQYDLAAEVGVKQPSVSRWEAGIETPSGPSLKMLELLFDAPTPERRSESLEGEAA